MTGRKGREWPIKEKGLRSLLNEHRLHEKQMKKTKGENDKLSETEESYTQGKRGKRAKRLRFLDNRTGGRPTGKDWEGKTKSDTGERRLKQVRENKHEEYEEER